MAASRWIISAWPFHEHESYNYAKIELKRLQEKCPDKEFRMYRIKTTLEKGSAGKIIRELEAKINELEKELQTLTKANKPKRERPSLSL